METHFITEDLRVPHKSQSWLTYKAGTKVTVTTRYEHDSAVKVDGDFDVHIENCFLEAITQPGMVQLVEDGKLRPIYFENINISLIVIWINENLDNFGLIEAFSCTAEIAGNDHIIIRGDEDYISIRVKQIVPIKL